MHVVDLFAQQHVEEVKLSQELIRIARMPRRRWDDRPDELESLVAELTDILRTPKGEQTLWPIQAVALLEMGLVGGLFGPLPVGCGKTLVSFLAPVVMEAERPLLIIPAKLAKKTEREMKLLRRHWRIPEFLRIMTFEWLGREQASKALDIYKPDLIIKDEAQKARNLKASVTRRLRRFASSHPECKWVELSGTMTKRSLHDYAHLLFWALKQNSPLPDRWDDLELWADAIDQRKNQIRVAHPGALEVLCNEEEREIWKEDAQRAARLGYQRRLTETEGVVSYKGEGIGQSLIITSEEAEDYVTKMDEVDEAFAVLRKDWETPDGWTIADALTHNRHAREFALGFYQIWNPRPPKEWLEPRRLWHATVRQVLKHSRKLDSELQVRNWVASLPEHEEFWKTLHAWDRVRDTFTPNTEVVWMSDAILEFCAEWAREHRGIIWTEHVPVGERLEKDFGITYYGKRGQNSKGQEIEDHKPGTPMVASVQSSGEGRNLQAWHTNLITSFPANGSQAEQLLARTHRPGQEADEVEIDVLTLCAEHVISFWQAKRDSEYVAASMGAPQKLLVADITMPATEDIVLRHGARWQKYQY